MERISLLVCDGDGNILDHPDYEPAGQSGREYLPLDPEELVEIPEGTKVFFLPGSHAVGWDRKNSTAKVLTKYRAVTAMLQAGYTRTMLPAAAYPGGEPPKYGCDDYLPLWAYAAVGWRDGKLVASAFRSDPMTHSETQNYDDRMIAPRVEERAAGSENRLIRHLSRCALEYHCFAAKNFFMDRWEAPLPTAPTCNARCIGCISLQPADCCPASQDRIDFIPTTEELCEVAVGHLDRVERGIVSFGQGCEGEPLLVADRIAEAVTLFRERTQRGTIHLNTNGSLPSALEGVIAAGLDSVRISMNSPVADTYNAYYRPQGYRMADVVESLSLSVKHGLFTALNLLVFPGVTDLPEEVEALEELVGSTGLTMIHFRNLSIDPRLYLEGLDGLDPEKSTRGGEGIGIRKTAIRLKEKFPKLDIGYFNRPKEEFAAPLTSLDFLKNNAGG